MRGLLWPRRTATMAIRWPRSLALSRRVGPMIPAEPWMLIGPPIKWILFICQMTAYSATVQYSAILKQPRFARKNAIGSSNRTAQST